MSASGHRQFDNVARVGAQGTVLLSSQSPVAMTFLTSWSQALGLANELILFRVQIRCLVSLCAEGIMPSAL